MLRIVEVTDRIAHIPRGALQLACPSPPPPPVVTPSRTPTSSGAARPTSTSAAGVSRPTSQFGNFAGLYRVVHRTTAADTVAIVLAPRGVSGLAEAARVWAGTLPAGVEIGLGGPADVLDTAVGLLERAGLAERLRVATVPDDATQAAGLAAAAAVTGGRHLVLLRDPAVGITHDWVARLAGFSRQPQIAIAGPVVLAPDGRIAHAGVALPEGRLLHLLHGAAGSGSPPLALNLTAVDGALITAREVFERLGGLDQTVRELAFVDFCLRAGRDGLRVVSVPDVKLRLTSAAAPVNDLVESERLCREWNQNGADPYYSRHFRADRGDFLLLVGP